VCSSDLPTTPPTTTTETNPNDKSGLHADMAGLSSLTGG
jgi:hypothetical protein